QGRYRGDGHGVDARRPHSSVLPGSVIQRVVLAEELEPRARSSMSGCDDPQRNLIPEAAPRHPGLDAVQRRTVEAGPLYPIDNRGPCDAADSADARSEDAPWPFHEPAADTPPKSARESGRPSASLRPEHQPC